MWRNFLEKVRRLFIYDEMEDVRDFHVKFGLIAHGVPGHLTKRKLNERVEFLQEELNEFKAACDAQDLAEQADALIDLVYVAKGTAVMLGLPWEDLWLDVQRANMTKMRGVGKRGHQVDVIKPKGWQGPMTAEILYKFGYNPESYSVARRSSGILSVAFDEDGQLIIREELCRDDALQF